MISWNKALIAALKVIVYSVIWWIVGGIIMLFGLGMMGGMTIANVLMSGKAPNVAYMFTGFIITAIGYIIAIIGSLAAFMKVFTELVVEEVSKHLRVLKKFDAI